VAVEQRGIGTPRTSDVRPPCGLYAAKPWFTRRLAPLEDALAVRGVRPGTVTAAGAAFGWAAGTCLALGALLDTPALWMAVGPLGVARLAANALDGRLARRSGAAGPSGVVANEVGDRLGDVGLLAGVAAVTSTALAAGALAAALAASLVGVLALAVTGRRDCGGPFGKAERVAVVGLGAAAAGATGAATPITVAAAAVLAGGVVTAVARLVRLRRATARTPRTPRAVSAP